MKAIKIRVEEIVKETEKAVNVKLAVYKNHKDYDWCFWMPKSVVEIATEFDECTNQNELYATVKYWFYEKMVTEFGGKVILASRPFEMVA